MTSADPDDALSVKWDINIKLETPEFLDLDSYDGQGHKAEGRNKDNSDQGFHDSDDEPISKAKKSKVKTKKKRKKSQPWRSKRKYPCTECDYVANRYNNLTAHMGKHSDIKNLFCDFCSYSTRYKTSLRRHVKYQHVLNNTAEDCPWCDFQTSFKCNLKTHIQRLHSCSECQFKGTEDEISSHFNETHTAQSDALSKYLLKKQKNLPEAPLSSLIGSKVKPEPYTDSDNDVDDSIFTPECEIMEISHVLHREGEEANKEDDGSQCKNDTSEEENKTAKPKRDVPTNDWPTKTTTKTTLKKKSPIEENQFSCSECEFTTRRRDVFVKHMQTNHDPTFQIDYSHKCRHCDYSTRFKHNLKLHETKHTGEKIYKCNQCDYGTSYNTVFQRHQRKHAQKLLGPFYCEKCSFTSTTQGRLQYHMQRSHQIVNDTAFKCDYCDFYTDIKWRLNKHRNKSQNNGEIMCPYCEFVSSFKCQMRMHKKEHLWQLGGSDKSKEKLSALRKSALLYRDVVDGETASGYGQVSDSEVQHSNSGVQVSNSGVQVSNSDVHLSNICEQVSKSDVHVSNSVGQLSSSDIQHSNSILNPSNNSGHQSYSEGQHSNSSIQNSENGVQVSNSSTHLSNNEVHFSNSDGHHSYSDVHLSNSHIHLSNSQFSNSVGHAATLDSTSNICVQSTQNISNQKNDFNILKEDSNDPSHYTDRTDLDYTDQTQYQSTSMSNNYTISTSVDITPYNVGYTQNNMELPEVPFSFCPNDSEQSNYFNNSYTIEEGAIKLNQVKVGFDRTQEKPYSCFQCVFQAKYKATVQRHYLRHHATQLKPYKCKFCGLQTTTRDAMWKHIKRIQTEVPVNCECNQFSTRYRCEFLQHRKLHNSFQCDLCSVTYKRRYDLERHMLNHLKDTMHKCKFCDFSTEKEYTLLQHEAFHLGSKPFKCTECSYSTVKELLLRLHFKKWHGHLLRVKRAKDGKNDTSDDIDTNDIDTNDIVNEGS